MSTQQERAELHKTIWKIANLFHSNFEATNNFFK